MKPPRTTIVIACAGRIFRQALSNALEQTGEFLVASSLWNGYEVLAMLEKSVPEFLLLDLRIAGMNAIDLTRQIRSSHFPIRVLGLAFPAEVSFFPRFFDAGASGIIDIDGSVEEISSAVATVRANRRYVSPSVAETLVCYEADVSPDLSHPDPAILTRSERRVLELISEGKNTKEIGRQFSVSHKTIEVHRMNIKHKLQLQTDAELTRYALRQGISTL